MAYSLTQEQFDSAETFIGKLEDSMVKSHIEKIFAEVKPTMRITTEQMEKFVSLSNNLPTEVQNFPQSFSMALKNQPHLDNQEREVKDSKKINLMDHVDDSIKGVKNAKAPKNKEEIEHKLGTKAGSVEAGKSHAHKTTAHEKEEGIKEQKKDGEKIIARNAHSNTKGKPTKSTK